MFNVVDDRRLVGVSFIGGTCIGLGIGLVLGSAITLFFVGMLKIIY